MTGTVEEDVAAAEDEEGGTAASGEEDNSDPPLPFRTFEPPEPLTSAFPLEMIAAAAADEEEDDNGDDVLFSSVLLSTAAADVEVTFKLSDFVFAEAALVLVSLFRSS